MQMILTMVLVSNVINAATSRDNSFAELQAVDFTQVKIDDGFWSPRLEANRTKTLPVCFNQCEITGRISNFAKAGGLIEGKFEGIYFNDSDVYKVLEGAAYVLAANRDEAVEKKVDEIIRQIRDAFPEKLGPLKHGIWITFSNYSRCLGRTPQCAEMNDSNGQCLESVPGKVRLNLSCLGDAESQPILCQA